MKAFSIAAATVPTPITQKGAATQSGATEKTDFHQVLRLSTSDLGVTSSSTDAKNAASATPKLAAHQAATSDASSLPTPIATPEGKPSKNASTLVATSDVVPDQATETTVTQELSDLTLSSKISKSAPTKSAKAVHPASDSTRTDKATAAPLESSQQLGISAQPAPPPDTPAKIASSSGTVQLDSLPAASGAVTSIDRSEREPLAQQQSAASAPWTTSPSPAVEAAPDGNDVAMLAKIVAAPPSASLATNSSQAPAASQKVGTRAEQSIATKNSVRSVVPEPSGATSLERLGVRVSAHPEALLPEASGAEATHSTRLIEAKSPTSQASHTNQMRQDTTTVPITSAQDKDARTTSPDHDANISLGMMAHAALMREPATVQTASPQTAAESVPQSAFLQGAASMPAVAAHTVPGSALSDAAAQPPALSTSTAEPPHAIDTAQLRMQDNQSELKVSVQLPELGKVEVRAVSTHDATTAHVTVFRHDAIPMLAAERSGLEQALRSHNVILGSVGSHAQGHASPQQRQHSSHTPAQSGTAPENATVATTVEASYSGFLPDHASISVRA